MKVPDLYVGKRFFVGEGDPTLPLGRGPTEVRGSGMVEGPLIVGNTKQSSTLDPFEIGSQMVNQCENEEMKPIPFYALIVKTFARIKSYLKVDVMTNTETIKAKIIYSEVIIAKVKNFAIKHPQLPNTKLVYACLEGPENGVYVRGRLRNSNKIGLPEVWKDLIDKDSITVSLTPIGADQSLVVQGITDNQVVIKPSPGLPIDCYYHIFAERKDVEKLKTEITCND